MKRAIQILHIGGGAQELTENALRDLQGDYSVVSESNVSSAMSTLESDAGKFSCIICEHEPPEIDAIECYRRLNRRSHLDPAFVVCTASGSKTLRHEHSTRG